MTTQHQPMSDVISIRVNLRGAKAMINAINDTIDSTPQTVATLRSMAGAAPAEAVEKLIREFEENSNSLRDDLKPTLDFLWNWIGRTKEMTTHIQMTKGTLLCLSERLAKAQRNADRMGYPLFSVNIEQVLRQMSSYKAA